MVCRVLFWGKHSIAFAAVWIISGQKVRFLLADWVVAGEIKRERPGSRMFSRPFAWEHISSEGDDYVVCTEGCSWESVKGCGQRMSSLPGKLKRGLRALIQNGFLDAWICHSALLNSRFIRNQTFRFFFVPRSFSYTSSAGSPFVVGFHFGPCGGFSWSPSSSSCSSLWSSAVSKVTVIIEEEGGGCGEDAEGDDDDGG